MMSAAYLPQSPRLLDRVREMIRYKHYSLKTEEAYLYWIRFFCSLTRSLGGDALSPRHGRF